MSNLYEGGMTADQKKAHIVEAIEEVSADIIDVMYRIIFFAESGME